MNQRNSTYALNRRGSGYSIQGPGFYIWDEDPRGLRNFAGELHSSSSVTTLPAEQSEAMHRVSFSNRTKRPFLS